MSLLLELMARLRDPDGGCPWDLEQTPETLARYAIEEAYEVEDAVRRGDTGALVDELGDLLLQVVFHAQLAAERGAFRFEDVVEALVDKLVRRHPHVFADAKIESAAEQSEAWEALKTAERADRAARQGGTAGALEGVPLALPALLRASKLVGRAAREGFAWPDASAARDKVREQLGELDDAFARGDEPGLRAEIGDLLFAVAALARRLDVDPEQALRQANAKFERRFAALERALDAEGRRLPDAAFAELTERWARVRREVK
jgi:MazG family protein